MAVVKALIKNSWFQRLALALAGAMAGFAYYSFVGCDGGCPLTGNPWSSTAYGALIGYLVHPGRRKPDVTPESASAASESKEG